MIEKKLVVTSYADVSRKEGDIVLTEKQMEKLSLNSTRQKMYLEGLGHQAVFSNLLELKTESYELVYKNGNVFIEYETRIKDTSTFKPSGISTTTSAWWAVTLKDGETDEFLEQEGAVLIPVEKIRKLIETPWLYGIQQLQKVMYKTGDENRFYLIPLQHVLPFFDAVTTRGLKAVLNERQIK